MAYQINLTGKEINERLQNVGTAEDVAAADGTLYARISKNADDVDELRDTVGHIDSAQTATDKTVTQHTADISTLQTAVGNNKTEQDAIAQKVEKNATAIGENTTTLNDHETRLSDVEDLVHRGLPVYGVEWNVNQTSSDVKRIGIPELHRTLPCHQLRGCLLADNGTVNEYLPQDDWTSATRDGSKGQVMVEIPEMWMKFEVDGDMRRVLLSPVAIGGFKHYQKRYVSAYEATVQRSTNKLASVVNTTEDYRGGLNNADLDGTANTMLGKPVSGLMKGTYRTYARNRYPNAAWNMYVYDVHCQLTWLFVVEYATLDSQKAFNAELTADGYHQGGLGEGLTNLMNSDFIEMKMSPIAKCGYTDELGNNTGEKVLTLTFATGEKNVSVCRYRGIENIIGNVSAIVDGIWAQSNGAIFIKTEPMRFSPTRPTDSELTCWRCSEAGFIQNIDESAFTNGWAIPKTIGSNAIYRDCNAFNNDSGDLCVYLGGGANTKSPAGLFLFASMSTDRTDTTIGTRLCYLPQEDNSGTLRDLYISAGAKYNEATGYYELNGLTDITEEEMRVIYKYAGTPQTKSAFAYSKARTNLPMPGMYNGSVYETMFYGCPNLEVAYLGNKQSSPTSYDVPSVEIKGNNCFYLCKKLKKIYGKMYQINSFWNLTFGDCLALEEVRITELYSSIQLSWSPNLSKESVQYMITNANPPRGAAVGSITITLHPTAYARLKDDADIVAALEAKGGIITLVSA